MKNAMSKRVIALVMMGSMMGTTVAQAAEVKKDESVYVTLGSTGSLEKVTVSDWIHSDESGVTVFDKSELKNIKNVKSDVTPEKNGENLIWDMDGSNLYYQGTTNKDVPLDISIKYYYEDKEIDPEDLAGKSGKVKIEIDVKNKEYKEVNINGKTRKIYTPFVVAGELTLPNDKFENITTEGATTISEGNNVLVAFAKMPGLSESLQLDSIPFDKVNEIKDKANILNDKKIVVEANAEEFSLGPIMITATADTSMLEDLDGAADLTEYKKKLDNLTKISNESSKLDGMINLIKSDEKVAKSRELLNDAEYAKGMETDSLKGILFNSNLNEQLNQGEELLNKLDDLNKNKKLEGMLNKYNLIVDMKKSGDLSNMLNGGKTLLGDYDEINAEVQSVSSILSDKQMMSGVSLLLNDINNMESAYGQLTPQTKQVLKVLSSNITLQNINAIETMTTELTPVQENLKEAINAAGGINNFVTTLRSSLSALGTLSQNLSQVDFASINTDVSNYGSAYLVLRGELMASAFTGNLEAKKAELKGSVDAVYKSSPELAAQLKGAIDKLSNDLTPQAIQKDCENAQKNAATLQGLSQGVKTLQGVTPLLNQINNLTSDEAKLKTILSVLTGENQAMTNLKTLANAVCSLPQDQQQILIGMAGNLGNVMDNIDSNAENIKKIKLLAGKYLSEGEIARINGYASQLNGAKDTVNKLKAINISVNDIPDDIDLSIIQKIDSNKINDARNLLNKKDELLEKSKHLLTIQEHLKNDKGVLEVMKNSLEKGNIDEARKMIDELPNYKSDLDKLNDGLKTIDELSLAKDEITKVSKDYGCFSGKDESVKGSTKFIMKTKEIKYEAPKEEEKKEEATEKKGFFAWIKSLLGID